MSPIITLSMIVKNEETTLPVCLKSIKDFVDKIIIVDTGSSDQTVEVAKSFGAQVERFDWINDFSAARNYALSFVTTPWTLWLDADDMVMNPEIIPHDVEYARKYRVNAIWSIYDQDASCYQRRLHLFKTRDFEFRGFVHETPTAFCPPRAQHLMSNLTVRHLKPHERAPEAAQKYLDILLEKDPTNWLGIAESYKFMQDWPKAIAYYWEASQYKDVNKPTQYLAYFNVAALSLEHAQENVESVRLAIKGAILGTELWPERAECWTLLGQGLECAGNRVEAAECYRRAVSCQPPDDTIGVVYREYYGPIPERLLAALDAKD